MNATRLEVIRREEIVVLSLVPPEGKPPTLDEALLEAMNEAINTIADAVPSSAAPRLMVVRSGSERCFCAGANIAALRGITAESIGEWVRRGHEVFRRIETLQIPTVARVAGFALGGGLELALSCDLIFAGSSARFGQTEAKIGFVPGWGGSGRLPARIGQPRAKEMFFTGMMVEAGTAKQWGLADRVVADAHLDGEVDGFAAEVRALSPVAIAGFKRILERNPGDWESVRDFEAEESVSCVESDDTKKRIRDFFESRPARKA